MEKPLSKLIQITRTTVDSLTPTPLEKPIVSLMACIQLIIALALADSSDKINYDVVTVQATILCLGLLTRFQDRIRQCLNDEAVS